MGGLSSDPVSLTGTKHKALVLMMLSVLALNTYYSLLSTSGKAFWYQTSNDNMNSTGFSNRSQEETNKTVPSKTTDSTPFSQTKLPSESDKESSQNRLSKRIQFTIFPNQTHSIKSPYACREGRSFMMLPRRFPAEAKNIDRLPMPQELSHRLVVQTLVHSTHLKLLFVGDSLSWQFHNLWTSAIQSQVTEFRLYNDQEDGENAPKTKASISREHNNSGLAVYYRTNNFISNRTDQSLPNATRTRGEMWSSRDALRLLNTTANSLIHPNQTIQTFDVMFHQIPVAWITSSEVTDERILESLQASHRAFRVRHIVLVTPHFTNNILTPQDFEELQAAQARIRKVVNEWQPSSTKTPGLETVVLFDFANYTDTLLEENTKAVGFNTSNVTIFDRLSKRCFAWPPSLRLACGEVAVNDQCQCRRNLISADGMHLCMTHVGGHMVATWSCILQCIYSDSNKDHNQVKTCSHKCHEQYLTLKQF